MQQIKIWTLLNLIPIVSLQYLDATSKPNNETYHVCNSSVCLERAKLINESMDKTADPCEDFYTYACGGWQRHHKIPNDEGAYNNFLILKESLIKTLQDILQNISLDYVGKQDFPHKAAVFYNACVAVEDNDTIQSLKDQMNASGLADWPITSGNTSYESWADVLLNTGISPVLEFRVGRDHFNITDHIIQMDEPSFPIVGREQLIDPDDPYNLGIIQSYKNLIQVAAKLLKSDISEEDSSELADRVVLFEGRLANLTTPPEEKTNFSAIYFRTTVQNLQTYFPGLPLLQLLNKDFDKVNITLTDQETLELFALPYYEQLIEFLNTSDRTLFFNYAGTKFVLSMAAHTSHVFRKALLELRNVTEGVQSEKPRWQYCVELMDDMMPLITGYFYVTHQFTPKARTEVEYLVDRLKESFNETLMKTGWMDEKTRSRAVTKLDLMGAKIGYPEWILNVTLLENIYARVPSTNVGTPFLKIWLSFWNNTWLNELGALRQPYPTDDVWPVGPTDVNAFYDASVNEMIFPSGVLQGNFYQTGLPWSLNFGGIGTFIGHELAHGFDTIGIQLDEHGELYEWFSPQSVRAFHELSDCFVQQYGSIWDEEANMTLNGDRTINENIADNGGLRTAYRAYEKLLKEECNNEDTRLQGLEDLSGKKLFFISFAMVFCSVTSTQNLQYDIRVRAHTPDRYRVNVSVSNMKAFSTIFQCDDKRRRAPQDRERCTLW